MLHGRPPTQTQSPPLESGLQPNHPVAEQRDQPSQSTASPGSPPSRAAQVGGERSDQAERPSDRPAARIRLKAEGAEKPEIWQAQARQQKPRRKRTHGERVERVSSPSGQRASGLESLSQAEKAELEQRGRSYAARALQNTGYAVQQTGERSPGYDLLATKGHETLEVEVKAHLRTASKVFVPKGEWREYLRTKGKGVEHWELWNVENLAEDADERVRITRYAEIPADAIEESGFWVDLRLCSSDLG